MSGWALAVGANDVLPFALFAVFLAFFYARNRTRGEEVAAEPAPPLRPIDVSLRGGLFLAWALGLVGIVAGGELAALLAPAGLILAVLGCVLIANPQDVRGNWAQRLRRSWSYRTFGTTPANPVWFGPALLFIGLCWLAIGVLEATKI